MAMFTIFERKVILFTHFAIPLSPTLCEAGLTMNTGSAATIVMKEEEEMKEEEVDETAMEPDQLVTQQFGGLCWRLMLTHPMSRSQILLEQ